MTTRRTNTQDDKPFDFNLDAVKAEVDLTPFRITWGGKRWSFTHAQDLDSWELIEAADKGDIAQVAAVFRAALGKQWDAFKKIPLPQYKAQKLFEAYQKHCGLEPGESQGSTDS